MKRIVFIAWGGRGKYRHVLRALTLASILRKEAEIRFVIKCEGRTPCMVIDKGFPFSFLEEGIPEGELYYIDAIPEEVPELPEEGKKIFFFEKSNPPYKGIKFNPFPLDSRDPYRGAKVQVLSPRFRHFHLFFHRRKFKKKGKHLLLALSSQDSLDFIGNLIEGLYSAGFSLRFVPHFEISNYHLKKLRKTFPAMKIVRRVNDLARAFFKCDLAVLSGKLKPFEAAATGTPFILIGEDDDYKEFEKRNIAVLAKKEVEEVVEVAREIAYNLEKRKLMAESGVNLVDGLGLYRVARVIRSELE